MILGVYGAGGLGREVLELARRIDKNEKRWDEMVFIIDGKPETESLNGARVLSYEAAKAEFGDSLEVSVGVGEPATRRKLFEKLESDGIKLATLIDPVCVMPESTAVGRGSTIQYGCFFSPNITIGDYVYIQPQTNIGHDSVIKNGVILSATSNLGGNVTVGEYTYVGLVSAIKHGITIGDWCIVGMYSAVTKDVPDETVVVGAPARVLRDNKAHKVF